MKGKILIISNIGLMICLIFVLVFSISKVSNLNGKISKLEKSQKALSNEVNNYKKDLLENKKVVITKEDKANVKVNKNFEKDGLKLNVRKVEVNKEVNNGYRVKIILDVENLENEREINVGNLIKITDKNGNKVENTITFDNNLKVLGKNEDVRVTREYISETKEVNIKVNGIGIIMNWGVYFGYC